MAVPAAPSVASRAVYYSYAVPAPTYPSANAPSGGAYTQPNPSSVLPPDCGPAGVAMPAIVYALGGAAPDYQGMQLLVFLPTGGHVLRFANFTSNQPMLNVATWTTNGSNPLQARWQLIDALS